MKKPEPNNRNVIEEKACKLCNEKPARHFPLVSHTEVLKALDKKESPGEQIIFFLNRD